MIITPKNILQLDVDETYPNIIPGLKKALMDIDEIKGIAVDGQTRKTVTPKIFNRIHSFIKLSKNDYMLNLDDIITYMDNVNYVNKTALPIIYYAVTGKHLPPIVLETHLMNKFIMDGYRSLEYDEKPFFKSNYHANNFFLRKPSFSGSSVVSINDMKMYHQIEKFTTDFDDLITYIDTKGDIINVDDDFVINSMAYLGEKFVLDNIDTEIQPILNKSNPIIIDTKFSDEQKNAINSILTSNDRINCLTGPAGSGKTLVISSVIDNAYAQGKHIVCCAFTGKAASRMEQSEVDVTKILFPPKTIHSLMSTLKMNPGTDIDLVIIDEASTMNSVLFNEFVSVLRQSSTLDKIKFLFVGDSNQLPPIGSGQIFEDIITLKLYPTYRLTKIFRTTDQSMLDLYDDVLKSKHIVKLNKHKKYFKKYRSEEIDVFLNHTIDLLFKKDKAWYKDNKCIILTHTNKYVDYVNYLCYKQLTGKVIDFYEYTFSDHPDDIELTWEPIPWTWEGAKIIFTKNDKIDLEVNGEIIRVNNGTVADVVGFMDEYVIVQSYDDGRTFYIERDYDTVKLAYAMTVYKSQGSEAQYVIYIHNNHIFETKRLVYTALTRAKDNIKIYVPIDGFKLSLDVPRYTIINSQ